jgi:hypothetical protein
LLWIAERLRPFGSDRGAMIVEAEGQGANGEAASAKWALDATTNLGPLVPIIPTLALIRRVRERWKPEPGAYPCSGILDLDELATILDELGIGHSLVPAPPALRAAA